MPEPTNSMVHVDSALTNMSVAFIQRSSNFIASRVFPNIPVMKQSDRYFTYDRGNFNRDEATVRAPGTETSGSSYDIDSTPSYYCDVIGHHKDVPDQVHDNADAAINVDREATTYVTMKMMIEREAKWAGKYFTSGLWTTDITGVASSPTSSQAIQWSDETSSDPIGDIRAAKTVILESTGFEPNTLVVGQHVMDALTDHPDIVDRVKYSGGVGNGNPARVNEQTIAQLLGLDRIFVSKAIQNTAAKGETNSHSFIAGKHALLCYSPASPGLMTPAAGYTFSWAGHMGQTNEFGVAVKNYRIERLASNRVEGLTAYTQKLIAADLSYFWDGIVA